MQTFGSEEFVDATLETNFRREAAQLIDPLPERAKETRKFLGAEHNQPHHNNHQQLSERNSEHTRKLTPLPQHGNGVEPNCRRLASRLLSSPLDFLASRAGP